MMLLVDAGNTRIKWRIVDALAPVVGGAVATGDVAELAQAWRPHRLAGALVSCVAGAATQTALEQIFAAAGVAARWLVAEREKHGVINHYNVPEQLGADRYAALIAAAHMRLGDCVVAGIGTATTVDRLDRNGEFLGGIILPGPDLMRAALLGATAQIESRMQQTDAPPASLPFAARPPRDTAAAVSTGIALAQAGAIRAMCAAMPDAAEKPPLLLLTGGACDQVRAWLPMELIEVEDLVLEGLAWIAMESACAN